MTEPSKYDLYVRMLLASLDADAAVVFVIGGTIGSGFARAKRAQADPEREPELRSLFEAIERGNPYPYPCHQRAADPGCVYAVCTQRGVCLYPEPDGSRCSLILRGEP